MENQETKISNVTTSMKVEKEINGFKVSGTVEVYNDSKRIKRIDASVQKTDSMFIAEIKDDAILCTPRFKNSKLWSFKQAAKSRGEEQISIEPRMSEWGNPAGRTPVIMH